MTVNMVCCKDMYDSNCELGRIRTRSQLGEPIVPLSGVFLMCRNILIGTFESKSIGCDCLTWEEKYNAVSISSKIKTNCSNGRQWQSTAEVCQCFSSHFRS